MLPASLDAVDKESVAMLQVFSCPDPTCRAPARVVDRWTWASSDGPVHHVKTMCQRGHWFTPTVDSLRRRSERSEQLERLPAAV
jgi:hypothetical protein